MYIHICVHTHAIIHTSFFTCILHLNIISSLTLTYTQIQIQQFRHQQTLEPGRFEPAFCRQSAQSLSGRTYGGGLGISMFFGSSLWGLPQRLLRRNHTVSGLTARTPQATNVLVLPGAFGGGAPKRVLAGHSPTSAPRRADSTGRGIRESNLRPSEKSKSSKPKPLEVLT